ncbi:hypothetical protein [Microbacterium aerolatum]|nr:hypothetical protein [Microbacterium aerolatum]
MPSSEASFVPENRPSRRSGRAETISKILGGGANGYTDYPVLTHA